MPPQHCHTKNTLLATTIGLTMQLNYQFIYVRVPTHIHTHAYNNTYKHIYQQYLCECLLIKCRKFNITFVLAQFLWFRTRQKANCKNKTLDNHQQCNTYSAGHQQTARIETPCHRHDIDTTPSHRILNVKRRNGNDECCLLN